MPRPAPLAAASEPPTFDVVRVEPSGNIVLAGRGAPHAEVALLASGKVVAETKVDGNGNFVLIPPPLQAGDHDLTLRQSVQGAAPVVSRQNVAVKVRERGAGPAVVALAEPGKATELIASGTKAPARAVEPDLSAAPGRSMPAEPSTALKRQAVPVRLAFRSVELENGNGFYATGIAPPGTHVEIYLNNSRIAGVVADAGSGWSVKVLKGLTGGRYLVRADAIDGARIVTSRAEVAFDVPVSVAVAPAKGEPQPVPAPLASEAPSVAAVGAGRKDDLGQRSAETPAANSPIASERRGGAMADRSLQASAEARPPRGEAAPGDPIARRPDPSVAASAKTPERETSRADVSARTSSSEPGAAGPADSQVGAGAESAIIQSLETTRVVGGDTLWRISRTRLGLGHRYTQIYAANAAQIRDPNLIYPDQVFVMPVK